MASCGYGRQEYQCPVHGTFTFWQSVPACDLIIDTPEFARLRNLKQLGFTHYAFSSAEHSRYPHSLGTAHLAQQLVDTLKQKQPELGIEQVDVRRVTIAGLCHDLGHGPFSHTFEKDLLPRLGIHTGWHHEAMSCRILDLIAAGLPELPDVTPDPEDIKVIKQMIDQKQRSGGGDSSRQNGVTASGDKRFLFDIVSNHRNSIDVDKWDYLERDSLMCGHRISFSCKDMHKVCRVIGGELCWQRKQYMNLHEMFRSRERLHREVYTVPKVHAVNLMVADALEEASEVFGIKDMVLDAEEFVKLDDTLLQQILNPPKRLLAALGKDTALASQLSKAQTLLKQVQRGQLYTYVNEIKVPKDDVKNGQWKVPSVDDLISYYSAGEVQLSQHMQSIILSPTDYDFAMKGGVNPLDEVRFYENADATEAVKVSGAQASQMLPENFQETGLRLFCKSSDPQVITALEEAFKNWMQKRFGDRTALQESTPVKCRTPQASAAASAQRTGTASVGSVVRRPPSDHCSTPTSNAKRARND